MSKGKGKSKTGWATWSKATWSKEDWDRAAEAAGLRRAAEQARFAEEQRRVTKVETAFDRDTLRRICEMPERDFAEAYEMLTVQVPHRREPEDFYHFLDRGSSVLAVAHLDTVVPSWQRTCNFIDTAAGPVVYSGALDDRLGAYVLLELLPALGITYDVLLTVGEESGQSTAQFFEPPKDYNFVIEFDRGGKDVVMYQYEDDEMCGLVEASGARVGMGSFSDIAYLEHLGIKAFNWGVGYQDYHGPRSHAYLDDTFSMVAKYLKFHEVNADTLLPHEDVESWWLRQDEHDDDPDFNEHPSLAELSEVIENG